MGIGYFKCWALLVLHASIGTMHAERICFKKLSRIAKNKNTNLFPILTRACLDVDAAYICSLPSRVGFESGVSCLAAIPKYFFNQSSGQCEEFLYGGCGDQIANRFDSLPECQRTCAPLGAPGLSEDDLEREVAH